MTYLFLTSNHHSKLFSYDKWGYMFPGLYFPLKERLTENIFVDQNQIGMFSIHCLIGSSQNFLFHTISQYQFMNISLSLEMLCKTWSSQKADIHLRIFQLYMIFSNIPHLNCSPWYHWIQWWHTSLELKETIQSKKGLGDRLCEELLQAEQGS